MSKLIVGLTGGIGSGKTTIANLFFAKNINIIDADVIAREVVVPHSKALLAIEKYFGAGILLDDGQLNRSLLRSKVFSNEKHKLWLNALLHPIIREQIISQTLAAKSPYCLLVAPLLIENNLLSLVNRVLVVDISKKIQLERTLTRDTSSSKDEINAIIKSQVSRKERLSVANDIIDNTNCELQYVKERVTELHEQYLSLAHQIHSASTNN